MRSPTLRGGRPEWHIQGDVLPLLDGGCTFKTVDGKEHVQRGQWDIILAFPPCTFLCVTGNRWLNVERYGDKAKQRHKDREKAVEFFLRFANAKCDHIAIENPVGYMSTVFRKPDQKIQPWQFGDGAEKLTCLWLIGLPKLVPVVTEKPDMERYRWTTKDGRKRSQPLWYANAFWQNRNAEERRKERSKTFPGVAKAMAQQWGGKLAPYQMTLRGFDD